MMDEFGDPTAYEYSTLRQGEGLMLGTQVDLLSGEPNDHEADEGQTYSFEVEEAMQQLSGKLDAAICGGDGRQWHSLAEAQMSAYSSGIPGV